MRRQLLKLLVALGIGAASFAATAGDFDTKVPMTNGGAATYYVPGAIDGVGAVKLMVDTGSGYMTINEEALERLLAGGHAEYVKELRGVLANGSELIVPVYALSGITIGDSCRIENVQAAVFPGKTRFILGLSALQKASPFIFSMKPAELVLSNCVAEKVASR